MNDDFGFISNGTELQIYFNDEPPRDESKPTGFCPKLVTDGEIASESEKQSDIQIINQMELDQEKQFQLKQQNKLDDDLEFSLQASVSNQEQTTKDQTAQEPSSPHPAPVPVHSDMQPEVITKNLLDIAWKFLTSLEIDPAHYAKLSQADKETFCRLLEILLTDTGYQVALRQLETARTFKLTESQLKLDGPCKRDDASVKQVISAAFNHIKRRMKAKKCLKANSMSKMDFERLICLEFLGIANATPAFLDQMISYDLGVSKQFVSAITFRGQRFGLIKEIIKTIESGNAIRMYAVKVREQLERTFAAPGLPFMPIIKKREKDGFEYRTKPKVPVTLVEFRRHCAKTIETLKKRCKSLKIYDQVFGNLQTEQDRSTAENSNQETHLMDDKSEGSLLLDQVISKDAAIEFKVNKTQSRGRRERKILTSGTDALKSKASAKSGAKVTKSKAAKKESLASKVKEFVKSKANKAKPKSKAPNTESSSKKKRAESIIWKKTYRRVRSHNSKKGGRMRSQSL